MASMPLEIPLKVKIKGLKALVAGQAALAAQVQQLLDGQTILAGAAGALQLEVRELVTNVEQLSTVLDNIQADISGLKDAASVKAEADAATIAQLRTDLDAAIAAGDVSEADADALRTALATAEESLANAQADFDAGLAPVLAKAQGIDEQTAPVTPPGTPEEPEEPPVTPEEPPVEPEEPPVTPEEPPVTPEEPAPPVEEPTPEPTPEEPAPGEGTIDPV